MTDPRLDTLREAFVGHVQAGEDAMRSARPNVKVANRETRQMDALVQSWADRDTGQVRAVLLPLLEAEEPAIRCAAAAYLLYHAASDEAKAVLEALAADDDFGMVASQAETALMVWARRQKNKGR
jgi:hypothetical protein